MIATVVIFVALIIVMAAMQHYRLDANDRAQQTAIAFIVIVFVTLMAIV